MSLIVLNERDDVAVLTGAQQNVPAGHKMARHDLPAGTLARATEGLCEDVSGVDGAVALTHGTGCGMAARGEGWDLLRRTLAGYACQL